MIKEDAERFTVDVSGFVDKCKGRLKTFAREFIQDINEEIVKATPVNTGFLRGSWWARINGEPDGVASPDASGTMAVARLNLTGSQVELGDIYNMANGAAYARRMEFGFVGKDSLGREYHQAPRAFVRGTLDRAQEFADVAAQRVAEL